MVVERQVFTTWYTPEEKLPEIEEITIATISGRNDKTIYDHTFALVVWCGDEEGWEMADHDLEEFTVHAWCDLEPYGG